MSSSRACFEPVAPERASRVLWLGLLALVVACASGGESVHEDEPVDGAGGGGAGGMSGGAGALSAGNAGASVAGTAGDASGGKGGAKGGAAGMTAAGAGGSTTAGSAGVAGKGASGVGAAGASGVAGGGGVAGSAGGAGTSGGGGSVGARSCPAGELVAGLRADGSLVCGSVPAAIRGYVNSSCSVVLGWRDSCDGCASPPSKWGKVSADACSNGVGTDDVCISASSPETPVRLFGLNTDGNVDGNDVLFLGFTCTPAPTVTTVGCGAGAFASGFDATGKPVCINPSASAIETVNGDCSLYGGWRDSCDGCADAPAKWDRTKPNVCESLAGASGDTCGSHMLGSDTVNLLGLDFDGDVDGNDTIYAGFRCEGATTVDTAGAVDACPQGSFATGIDGAGKLACAPVSLAFAATVRTRCHFYAGWQDNCGGCSSPPTKWGRVTAESCEVGQGADCTCSTQTLGGDSIPLFGLNFDGDVGDDDLLSLGFHCF